MIAIKGPNKLFSFAFSYFNKVVFIFICEELAVTKGKLFILVPLEWEDLLLIVLDSVLY